MRSNMFLLVRRIEPGDLIPIKARDFHSRESGRRESRSLNTEPGEAKEHSLRVCLSMEVC